MRDVVQSPADEMTIEPPGYSGSWDGKVAKGCHSLKGDVDILRQEKRWMWCEKWRRSACEDRTSGVKVQRRRRSHGYISAAVMAERFQNVGLQTSSVPNVVAAIEL